MVKGNPGTDVPALQVIVLGSGGGPMEDKLTSFLVRSTGTGWAKGSILGVDAGVHLAAITKLLETHKFVTDTETKPNGKASVTLTDGPFEGLRLPYDSLHANAAYVTRDLVDGFVITHPHMDHISGFVVNTASLNGSRPKRLAGLPSTIEAFKTHIFNNVIWPNLSDENNGAGVVTYMRLVEGGSLAVGDGEGRGYTEICNGLSVKTWSVSHGHCIEHHNHRGSNASLIAENSPHLGPSIQAPRMVRSSSHSSHSGGEIPRSVSYEKQCVYDSSAYFIRDVITGKEVLIFGDVEPDSISLLPRNRQVWSDAAPKIISGLLTGIFIECSYDNSRADDLLFGHLCPRHLVEELQALALEVTNVSMASPTSPSKKRKLTAEMHHEDGNGNNTISIPYPTRPRQKSDLSNISEGDVSPRSSRTRKGLAINPHLPYKYDSHRKVIDKTHAGSSTESPDPSTVESTNFRGKPLQGVKIVIIHLKEKLDDGPDLGETILRQVNELGGGRLGCEFVISYPGQSLYF